MSSIHPFPGCPEALLPDKMQISHNHLIPTSPPLSQTSNASHTSKGSLSRPNQLLRLRNAGFRGPIIAPRQISREFPQSSQVYQQTGPAVYTGNLRRRSSQSNKADRSSVLDILEDRVNSASISEAPYAKSPKGHQKSTEERQTSLSPRSEQQHESLAWQPYVRRPSVDTMKLREGSLNPKNSPTISKSPATNSTKARLKHGLNIRTASFEATKYIEHLEGQLESAQTKLHEMTSPSSTQSQTYKLNHLASEAKSLRQDVLEWESKFNERVQVELEDRVELEGGLRARIRFLEKERESKDRRIGELEDRIELEGGLRARIKFLDKERETKDERISELEERMQAAKIDTRSLLYENDSLKRRLEHDWSSASMQLKSRDSSATYVAEIDSPRTSAVSPLAQDSNDKVLSPHDIQIHSSIPLFNELYGNKLDSDSFCPSPINTTGSSPGFSNSRPNSLISSTSFSPLLQESSSSSLSSLRNRPPSVKRRMRRFSTGANGPKPLILPTSTQGSEAIASPDIAESPWDETTPRARDRRYMTRVPPGKTNSVDFTEYGISRLSWRNEEALRILEANKSPTEGRKDSKSHRVSASSPSICLSYLRHTKGQSLHQRPQSLYTELSESQASTGNESDESRDYFPADCTPYTSKSAENVETKSNGDDLGRAQATDRRRYSSPASSRPSSPDIPKALTSTAWRDPIQLARAIILNAWSIGPKSSSTRESGWWLLGLLIGPEKRDEHRRRHGQRSRVDEIHTTNSAEASHARWAKHVFDQFPVTPSCERPAFLRCSECVMETEDRLWAWAKFSAALVLAIGIALRHGPARLLRDSSNGENTSTDSSTLVDETPSSGSADLRKPDSP